MFGWIRKIFLSSFETENQEKQEVEHSQESLSKLTKIELEELGREHGIELDRRKRKDTLVKELLEVLE